MAAGKINITVVGTNRGRFYKAYMGGDKSNRLSPNQLKSIIGADVDDMRMFEDFARRYNCKKFTLEFYEIDID